MFGKYFYCNVNLLLRPYLYIHTIPYISSSHLLHGPLHYIYTNCLILTHSHSYLTHYRCEVHSDSAHKTYTSVAGKT